LGEVPCFFHFIVILIFIYLARIDEVEDEGPPWRSRVERHHEPMAGRRSS
jgi:hypothetical protein